MKNGVPMPRMRGNVVQRADKSWEWEMNISVGEMSIADVGLDPELPGFLTKELAIANMRDHAIKIGKVNGEQAGTKMEGIYDLKKNEFHKTE